MEPEVRIFLVTIVQSMSLMLLWMLANTFFGIKMGLLFFEDGLSIWNVFYYVGMVVSFVFILRHIIAKWKKIPKFGLMEEKNPD